MCLHWAAGSDFVTSTAVLFTQSGLLDLLEFSGKERLNEKHYMICETLEMGLYHPKPLQNIFKTLNLSIH